MNNEIVNDGIVSTRKADPHGQAAMLLVESLIHGLIEKQLLSVADAVQIVDVAAEVKAESGVELGEAPGTLRASIDLLRDISASLRVDINSHAQRGGPV